MTATASPTTKRRADPDGERREAVVPAADRGRDQREQDRERDQPQRPVREPGALTKIAAAARKPASVCAVLDCSYLATAHARTLVRAVRA